MWDLDIDGIEGLEEMIKKLKENKIDLYFSWITEKTKKIIEKSDFYKELEKSWKIKSSTSLALKWLLK
jgi:hypothetical protein